RVVRARKEVILCGGAINSPQLLMLSGIGPAAHLAEHGIDVAHDLPGVGQNLMDHATMVMQWLSKKPLAFHGADQLARKAMIGLRWLMTRKGLAASSIWEAGGLIRGDADQPYPNLQYHFGAVGARYEGTKIKLMQAFSLHIDQLRPASRGEVRLRSADPSEKPALHFQYLSAGRDEAELVEGVRRARELVNAPAFDEWRGEEITPGPAAQTDAEITEAIRREVSTDYHPCGTCRMGMDDGAVVDEEMRVNGVEGLRVVDASVMPRIISANLNAPTQMIAARAADFILGREQRAAEFARFSFQVG
ncbi:MAG: GMC oxidoreductase, partial [Pikeienuella sp.]